MKNRDKTSGKVKREKNSYKITKKLNERWKSLQCSRKYRKARSKEAYKEACIKIEEEMMDGIFFNLKERHSKKSLTFQKKIMRRVIEKRQAQATFRKTGRTNNLRFASEIEINTRKCMEWLHRIRHAG